MSHQQCQSCAMPIESGKYCQYCADEKGNLHSFDESVERMAQFMSRQTPGLSPEDAQKQTLAYMAQMPAWRDHPKLKTAASK
jgi:hypothetical protein